MTNVVRPDYIHMYVQVMLEIFIVFIYEKLYCMYDLNTHGSHDKLKIMSSNLFKAQSLWVEGFKMLLIP